MIVGSGKIIPNANLVHGYQLMEGWVSVEVTKLHKRNVACWDDYPTLSEEIEEGSFSAWPLDQLVSLENSGKTS